MAEDTEAQPIAPKVVVATTVALSFISFWRGGAIVLSDLASTVFYVGGIAEQAVGRSAPWLVLGVMLFSFAVRAVYMEGCSMFVRGGVFAVVRNSMGPFAARVSVSALIFDYLLTGPISSVSAGHYLGHLVNEFLEMAGVSFRCHPASFAVFFAVLITLYFWRSNTIGIHESSTKALRIIQITTVMVLILLVWSPLTLLMRGNFALPPLPLPSNLAFTHESLGWFHGTFWPGIGAVGIMIAFGHAFLSMSGFETLAQVYRELAYPKLKNLKRTGLIVCCYAVVSTGLITMFAAMIIPDAVRAQYADNLIGGLAMNLAGPYLLRLVFHTFVVVVGALILAGAVNTAIIGANSVLNRVAEDGILFPWFRKPHRKYGTTYRLINLIVGLQLFTILISRGDVYLLGEAYAFGVVWSFFLKSCGVMVLRYQRSDQEYKVPLNIRIRGIELPIGLGLITLTLLTVALVNLFSKRIATIYGIIFTLVLFIVFTISERINARKHQKRKGGALEEFNLDHQQEITTDIVNVQPGGMLVAVRDYNTLSHLKWALDRTQAGRRNVIVATVRLTAAGDGEHGLTTEQVFADYEKELFSRVVQLAEKEGKKVSLLVVPAANPFEAMVQAAANLRSAYLVTGVSAHMSAEELARRIGQAWEELPEPRHSFSLAVMRRDGTVHQVILGPHTPRLRPQDVNRVHQLWLDLAENEEFGAKLHHRDVISLALDRLEQELKGHQRFEIVRDLRRSLEKPEA